ncbi:MAG: DUF5674 family protein [Elusimicrobiota bacterium]|nr:DUF5674 family protein [Endomicrobiia bacterium]MDW8166460.1 DUF5674 family protein [Elusimicrobiota bacterium]
MKIICESKKISVDELKKMAEETFGELVKATVDVEKEIIVVGGDLHSDQESLLLEQGSKQNNVWGINLYPFKYPNSEWIEFDSMINLRPFLGNKSRSVEDPLIREKIIKVLDKLIIK